MTPLGESNWKLAPDFPWTLPCAHFLLLMLIICSKGNHEYKNFAEFCESNELLILRVVLEIPKLRKIQNCCWHSSSRQEQSRANPMPESDHLVPGLVLTPPSHLNSLLINFFMKEMDEKTSEIPSSFKTLGMHQNECISLT